jgi:hypothetical protein
MTDVVLGLLFFVTAFIVMATLRSGTEGRKRTTSWLHLVVGLVGYFVARKSTGGALEMDLLDNVRFPPAGSMQDHTSSPTYPTISRPFLIWRRRSPVPAAAQRLTVNSHSGERARC